MADIPEAAVERARKAIHNSFWADAPPAEIARDALVASGLGELLAACAPIREQVEELERYLEIAQTSRVDAIMISTKDAFALAEALKKMEQP
jgi:hypothetical protein